MDFLRELQDLIPGSPGDQVCWDRVEGLLSGSGFADLEGVPQNPLFHGEGDVLCHTRMVCRELTGDPAFHELSGRRRVILFLAALFHDLGKGRTTRMEDGVWASPGHSLAGSRLAREFLWRDCGLCGTDEALSLRETVCTLIRFHMLPLHLLEREEEQRQILEVAAMGELAPDFSWDLLCLLAEADARGRISVDREECLTRVQLARLLAEERGCLHRPYPFRDSFAKHAFLAGRGVLPDQSLFDDTWGEVVLVCGLPGTGKDTWIGTRYPALPMVSLDEIRREMGVRPTDGQGAVIQEAKERAREHLRRKEPFVWNATNLQGSTRQTLTGLFEGYGARVRTVYLETPEPVRASRNQSRKDAVPEAVVGRMLSKTVPPGPSEAQTVEWICV